MKKGWKVVKTNGRTNENETRYTVASSAEVAKEKCFPGFQKTSYSFLMAWEDEAVYNDFGKERGLAYVEIKGGAIIRTYHD